MSAVGVGLLGCGTVGSGVARLLLERSERISRRAGRPIELKRVVVRDLDKPRAFAPPRSLLSTDARAALRDPSISIVIETIGGAQPALEWILEAFEAGKDVVTANKALLAEHGRELFSAARHYGRALAFEGAVGGGIPIVQAIGVALAANQIQSLAAILNGTCNFILTSMTQGGLTYEAALAEAQKLGYAEADPTLDVSGADTLHKLAILAQLAFRANAALDQIPATGIDTLQAADIKYTAELGYSVKLLAIARLLEEGLALRVGPTLVRHGTPLAEVRGPYNAIRVVGDAVGDTLFYGRGAGMMPTASAVVGDLIDVVVGRAALTSRVLDLWPEDDSRGPRFALPRQVKNRYYLRFTIADNPGVLGSIAQVLGAHGISIASVIQHDPGEDDGPGAPVPLVIMTHIADEASVTAALDAINTLEAVRAKTICLGVEE